MQCSACPNYQIFEYRNKLPYSPTGVTSPEKQQKQVDISFLPSDVTSSTIGNTFYLLFIYITIEIVEYRMKLPCSLVQKHLNMSYQKNAEILEHINLIFTCEICIAVIR